MHKSIAIDMRSYFNTIKPIYVYHIPTLTRDQHLGRCFCREAMVAVAVAKISMEPASIIPFAFFFHVATMRQQPEPHLHLLPRGHREEPLDAVV